MIKFAVSNEIIRLTDDVWLIWLYISALIGFLKSDVFRTTIIIIIDIQLLYCYCDQLKYNFQFTYIFIYLFIILLPGITVVRVF